MGSGTWRDEGSGQLSLNRIFYFNSSSFDLVNRSLAFSAVFGSRDLILTRDADSTLAQRNGTSPQESRIYGTYSSSGANYERFFVKTNTGGATQIGLSAAGTGQNRDLEFVTGGSTRMTVTSGGDVGIGTLTPAEKLDVIGNVVLSNNSGLKIRNNVGTLRNVIKIDSGNQLIIGENAGPIYINSANDQYFVRGGAFKMTLGSNGLSINAGSTPPNSGVGLYVATGNIGIGTSTPTAKLDILDTTLAGSGGLSGSALNIAQTWNTNLTPTALSVNVTDLSSNASSLLMDLRVGGVSRFSVDKSGVTRIRGTLPTLRFGGGSHPFFYVSGSNELSFRGSQLVLQGIDATPPGSLSFSRSDSSPALFGEASGTIAQRSGGTAQTFRLYNTFTDQDNYRRLSFTSVASEQRILAQAAGTGAAMSLNLGSGNSPQWQISTSGHLLGYGDNNFDIGSVSTNRPRDLHIARNAAIAGNLAASGSITGGDCILSGKLELNTVTRVSFGPQTSANPMLVRRGDALLGCRTGTNVSDASFSCSNLTASGDIEATDSTKGIILKSPDGTRYRITVTNGGALSSTDLTPPAPTTPPPLTTTPAP
jgi:hypothetical protein